MPFLLFLFIYCTMNKYYPLLYPLIVYLFLKYLFPIVSPFLIAYLIARVISSLTSKKYSLFIYFILLFSFLILLIFFTYQFIKNIYINFHDILQFVEILINQIRFLKLPTNLIMTSLFQFISHLLLTFPKIMTFIIMTMLFSFFFLLDLHAVGRMVYHLHPSTFIQCQKLQEILLSTFYQMMKSTGQLFLITWIECMIGLLFIQHPHFIFFAFIIACFDSMPLVGCGFILYPYALYLNIHHFPQQAIILVILGLFNSTLRFFIEPKIVSKQLNIPLLLHLFMMILCTKLFGFLGFFYSPILCTLLVLAYKEKTKVHNKMGDLNENISYASSVSNDF